MDALRRLLDQYPVGDIASVLGLLVSVVGFLLTIYGVRRSQRSAQRAEAAARQASETMTSMRSISDLASVVAALEELKRLHRTSAWPLLPDRYGSLRSRLVALRASRPHLTEDQQSILQGAIQHLTNLEMTVDRALALSRAPSNVPRLNGIVSDLIDKLTELLAQLHREETENV